MARRSFLSDRLRSRPLVLKSIARPTETARSVLPVWDGEGIQTFWRHVLYKLTYGRGGSKMESAHAPCRTGVTLVARLEDDEKGERWKQKKSVVMVIQLILPRCSLTTTA